MGRREIYRSSKEKKHIRVDYSAGRSAILQSKIANDIKQKDNSLRYRLDDENFNRGIDWFNSGLSLEEAPEDMKKDGSFIKGFNRGKTIRLVNDTLYATGKEYFEKGILLRDAPANYRNNEYFINGYNDSMNMGRHK